MRRATSIDSVPGESVRLPQAAWGGATCAPHEPPHTPPPPGRKNPLPDTPAGLPPMDDEDDEIPHEEKDPEEGRPGSQLAAPGSNRAPASQAAPCSGPACSKAL